MKKKIMMMTFMGLMGLSVSSSVNAGWELGTLTWGAPRAHTVTTPGTPPPCSILVDNWVLGVWLDPGMWVATGIDLAATNAKRTKKVKAKDAIKKLKEALEGGSGCNGGSDPTAQDATTATIYTAENISVVMELSKVDSKDLFDEVRREVVRYLFSTPDADIKGSCTGKDNECALQRQNEWLLASVTLASATADKVLNTTVKTGEADQTDENGKTTTTKGKKTPLEKHFQKLASDFNKQTVPTGMYDAMANIVLDTHRQINEANALMGRDLEAQGLRVVHETGWENLNVEGE